MEILLAILVGLAIGFVVGRLSKRNKPLRRDGVLEVSSTEIDKVKSLNLDDIEPTELAERTYVTLEVTHTE